MKKQKKALALFIASLSLVSVMSQTVAFAETEGETASRYVTSIIDTIERDYRFGADKEKMYEAVIDYIMKNSPHLLEGALDTLLDTLDKHSDYMTRAEINAFVNSVEKTYVGIGVTVEDADEGIMVKEVNENGGAYISGVLAGDIIYEVDGKNIAGLPTEKVTALIQGKAGTSVKIKVLRGAETIEFEIVRRKIFTETVFLDILDDVALIKITTFASSTPASLRAYMDELEIRRINKFIIDVRDNPGGELSPVIDVLEMFVPKGKILTKIEYNNPSYNTEITSNAKFSLKPNREIVVLANENSASAAELFAGAMQSHKIAKVVGTTTYGKGSVQNFMGLVSPRFAELGDIKLSIAEFKRADGSKINGVGIKPDVRKKNYTDFFDLSTFTPMTMSNKYDAGSVHKDVLAIEERLSALGYFDETPDENYTESTKRAVSAFQRNNALCDYGVMDYTTQGLLNDHMRNTEYEVDVQLDTALKMLT